ncbi:tyrosine-type recombinase/integrase [Aquisalibacillus elongatus]|uniref:Integrase/recombinase XerD n=1 Tax=Aquisalibacillus elongatus TaxID=485577 RepID=A0A3N5BAA9_9BACI|nr:tyrosine-type recombinase/integrase [Aquisalibacillus elongatus]RPF54414.1 integrase/recombinase XerD [Aquisalibacillus elongatus]
MRKNASEKNSNNKQSRRKNRMQLDDSALEAVKQLEVKKEGIERKQLPLESAIEAFLDYCELKGLRYDTLKYYTKELKQFRFHLIDLGITEPIENDLVDLTQNHIYEVIRFMKQKSYAVSTINTRLIAIKALLNWAVERSYISESPAKNVKQLRKRQEVGPTFSQNQLRKLLAAPDLHTFPGFRDVCIMTTLSDTGCRAGELVALKLTDVDLVEGTILFRINKNGNPRRIPMSKRLNKLLSIWIKEIRGQSDNDCLFISVDGGSISNRLLQQQIKHYSRKTGVEREVSASPHAFRRTFARNKIAAGVNIFVVQQYLGHSSLDMLKRYVAIYGPDLKESIEKGID